MVLKTSFRCRLFVPVLLFFFSLIKHILKKEDIPDDTSFLILLSRRTRTQTIACRQ